MRVENNGQFPFYVCRQSNDFVSFVNGTWKSLPDISRFPQHFFLIHWVFKLFLDDVSRDFFFVGFRSRRHHRSWTEVKLNLREIFAFLQVFFKQISLIRIVNKKLLQDLQFSSYSQIIVVFNGLKIEESIGDWHRCWDLNNSLTKNTCILNYTKSYTFVGLKPVHEVLTTLTASWIAG